LDQELIFLTIEGQTMGVRHFLSSLAGGAVALSGMASVAMADVTVKHAQGETTFAQTPQKVVVLDLTSLDTLHALGVKVAGVPGNALQGDLAVYQDAAYAKMGTVFEPDYEAVNALKPDLIIVGGRSAPKYAELAKIAPTLDMSVDRADYINSAFGHIRSLAALFGKDKQAEERISAVTQKIGELHGAAEKAGTGLVVLTTGGKMSAHGAGSRFGVMYADFGFKPAAQNLKTGNHGEAISPEFISRTNPDWLFVLDRDAAIGRQGQPAKAMLDTPLLAKVSAFQKAQVVYLDAAGWYLTGGGLGSLERVVGQLSEAVVKN
jgi:iron complex transport system substrate-binding protein